MMDFARRLAPPRGADPTLALPVLPALFAGEAPLRSAPLASPVDGPVWQGAPVAPPQVRPAAPAPAGTAAPALVEVPHASAPPRAGTAPAAIVQVVSAEAAPQRLAAAQPAWQPQPVPAPQASDLPARVDPERAAAREAKPLAASDPAPQPMLSQRAPQPLRVPAQRTALPSVLPAAHETPVVRPLSATALAGRALAPTAPPPVVHVTIDRIDVRAPAAPARPSAAPRRARAPSVSLGDYLRGPAGRRQGGA